MPQTVNGFTIPAGSDAISTIDDTMVTLAGQLDAAFLTKVTTPGAWTSWSAVPISSQGTITTASNVSSAYIQIGKIVIARWHCTVTNNGTGAGTLGLTLPVTSASGPTQIGWGRNLATGEALTGFIASSATYYGVKLYNNNYPVASGQSLAGVVIYEGA